MEEFSEQEGSDVDAFLSHYGEDFGYHMGINDEDGYKQRKVAWLDDEEEETVVNISKANRLRKLRKEEDEIAISGTGICVKVEAHHAKLNLGADLDSKFKSYDSGEGVRDPVEMGQVYHWELRTRTCLHKGMDEGSINGTTLCTAPVGSLFAAGPSSGIVNVYNRDEFLARW
ncbi:U3 small nucleolar RNA-associated protein 18-like protein [Bienertia sinuspersici]